MQQFLVYPKDAVRFSQIKSDVERGRIDGLTIYKDAKSEAGMFYVDDIGGNVMKIAMTPNGVVFSAYEVPSNDISGILSRLIGYYNIKVYNSKDKQLYGADDIRKPDELKGASASDSVPLDFPKIFKGLPMKRGKKVPKKPLAVKAKIKSNRKKGMWGKPYRYIKYKLTELGLVKDRTPVHHNVKKRKSV